MKNLIKKLMNLQSNVRNFEKDCGGPGFYKRNNDFKEEYEKIASTLIKQCPVLIYNLLDAIDIDKQLISDTRIICANKDKKSTRGATGYPVSHTLTFLEKESIQKMLEDKYNQTKHQQYYSEITSLIDNTLMQIREFRAKHKQDTC